MKVGAITLCWFSLLALAIWTGDNLHASEVQSSPAILEKSRSPNGSLALAVITNLTNAERRLALLSPETKAVLADAPLPKTAPSVGQSSTNTTVLWNTKPLMCFS